MRAYAFKLGAEVRLFILLYFAKFSRPPLLTHRNTGRHQKLTTRIILIASIMQRMPKLTMGSLAGRRMGAVRPDHCLLEPCP